MWVAVHSVFLGSPRYFFFSLPTTHELKSNLIVMASNATCTTPESSLPQQLPQLSLRGGFDLTLGCLKKTLIRNIRSVCKDAIKSIHRSSSSYLTQPLLSHHPPPKRLGVSSLIFSILAEYHLPPLPPFLGRCVV